MNRSDEFVVRKAMAKDMESVRQMIQELADFEEMPNGPKLTAEDLIRDAGLSDTDQNAFFHCYIVEASTSLASNSTWNADEPLTPLTPIGYSICFFTYSTWEGKSYFIEDIYIKPAYRKLGAGRVLFTEIVRIAKSLECNRVDFHVLAWNPARKFYEKMGAVDLTEAEQWHFYRVQKDEIDRILME